jgi:hypothetical protein
MPTLHIRERFAAAIIAGTKKMHIYHDENEQWAEGRPIYFRVGNTEKQKQKPYRLGYAVATKVLYVQVLPSQNKVLLQGAPVTDLEGFAILNGFDSWAKMKAYFEHSYTGVAIHWDNVELEQPPIVESEDKDEIINNLRAQLAFALAKIETLKNK